MHIIYKLLLASGIALATFHTAILTSAQTPVPAKRTDGPGGLVESIGVNTHLTYPDTVYYTGYDAIIKPRLLESHIRYVRHAEISFTSVVVIWRIMVLSSIWA